MILICKTLGAQLLPVETPPPIINLTPDKIVLVEEQKLNRAPWAQVRLGVDIAAVKGNPEATFALTSPENHLRQFKFFFNNNCIHYNHYKNGGIHLTIDLSPYLTGPGRYSLVWEIYDDSYADWTLHNAVLTGAKELDAVHLTEGCTLNRAQ